MHEDLLFSSEQTGRSRLHNSAGAQKAIVNMTQQEQIFV